MILLCLGVLLIGGRRGEATTAWVAYFTTEDQIGVVRVDGQAHRRFALPVITPDDLVWRDDATLLFIAAEQDRFGLYSLRLADGQVRRLIELPADLTPGQMQLAPDGRSAYFIGYTRSPSTTEMYRAALDSGAVTPLTHFGQADVRTFDLTPDGRRLVVTVNDNQPPPVHSFVMDADGANLTPVPVNHLIYWASWMEGGRSLLAVVYDSNGDHFYRLHPDGSDLQRFAQVSQPVGYHDVSPDGKRVLYHVECTGGLNTCIYRVDSDGRHVQQITSPKELRLFPQWSLDGTWIGFAETGWQRISLWRMRADGTDQRRLADDARSYEMAWSPPIEQRWSPGLWLGVGGLVILTGPMVVHRRRKRAARCRF